MEAVRVYLVFHTTAQIPVKLSFHDYISKSICIYLFIFTFKPQPLKHQESEMLIHLKLEDKQLTRYEK